MNTWRCVSSVDGWAIATVVEYCDGSARLEEMRCHLFLPSGQFVLVRAPHEICRMAFMVQVEPDEYATPLEMVPDELNDREVN